MPRQHVQSSVTMLHPRPRLSRPPPTSPGGGTPGHPAAPWLRGGAWCEGEALEMAWAAGCWGAEGGIAEGGVEWPTCRPVLYGRSGRS